MNAWQATGRPRAKLLTKDEARRVAVIIAKLPGLMRNPKNDSWAANIKKAAPEEAASLMAQMHIAPALKRAGDALGSVRQNT
jgi:hypothetical protein